LVAADSAVDWAEAGSEAEVSEVDLAEAGLVAAGLEAEDSAVD
jgi:hypothetical protein